MVKTVVAYRRKNFEKQLSELIAEEYDVQSSGVIKSTRTKSFVWWAVCIKYENFESFFGE